MKKQLSFYSLIGLLNTLVHWSVFGLIVSLTASQTLANGGGFVAAATTSYFLNARFTFIQKPHKKGYLFFVLGMGTLSLLVGRMGDIYVWPSLVTLILFSLMSLILGFIWSKFVVFKRPTDTR
ncbi:MAG: GtrA family protein [Pseudomonadota bacterium]